MLGALQRHVAEKRPDRREADITAARGIGPSFLQVVKKRADEYRIQIRYCKFGWRLPQLLLSKLQQQTKVSRYDATVWGLTRR